MKQRPLIKRSIYLSLFIALASLMAPLASFASSQAQLADKYCNLYLEGFSSERLKRFPKLSPEIEEVARLLRNKNYKIVDSKSEAAVLVDVGGKCALSIDGTCQDAKAYIRLVTAEEKTMYYGYDDAYFLEAKLFTAVKRATRQVPNCDPSGR